MAAIDLPYFDILLPRLDRGDEALSTAFGRHVHWGYWDESTPADGSYEDFARAAERMCVRVCDAAEVQDGMRILDVGCGLGGTVASLNERLRGCELQGLNIDERQLEYARKNIQQIDGNQIDFVAGDACEMPLDDASFDRVLAVECAFHFESRRRFLQEVARVLKPGGRLALCDFMPLDAVLPIIAPTQRFFFYGYVKRIVGPTDLSYSLERYADVAADAGLRLVHSEDVTQNTLATYPVIRRVARRLEVPQVTAHWGTAGMQLLGRTGLLRYIIAAFEKA